MCDVIKHLLNVHRKNNAVSLSICWIKSGFVKKLNSMEQNSLHFWNQQEKSHQKHLTVIKPQKICRPVLFMHMLSNKAVTYMVLLLQFLAFLGCGMAL